MEARLLADTTLNGILPKTTTEENVTEAALWIVLIEIILQYVFDLVSKSCISGIILEYHTVSFRLIPRIVRQKPASFKQLLQFLPILPECCAASCTGRHQRSTNAVCKRANTSARLSSGTTSVTWALVPKRRETCRDH
jgi:hypothetical protein